MSKAEKIAKEKEMSLEELFTETEEKITNPDYVEHGEIEYKGIKLKFSFRPLKQRNFSKIQKTLLQPEGTARVLSESLINNNTKDKSFFTEKQVQDVFKPGIANNIVEYILEDAGFNLTQARSEALRGF